MIPELPNCEDTEMNVDHEYMKLQNYQSELTLE